ncbi:MULTISPECIES: DUF3892 domain-containing protein [unclassified Streptomyces]|uniref:DUF3892 domain-containing protein n=1 Tax=unclassified Streptomyces TaxID=2593676 RepID=UPI0023664CE9|nr:MULTISPECIES: DUF3892 domain-containing protein [unclassified Streptomyces]MDF3142187.1 DUF3892 domain-containing protein [Streptomyces sp. T21Q-yed]WDF42201.1 DUF3892 domain-containing protein [Streptomyces sp. T12]
MTFDVHGGYDQCVFLDQALASMLAGASFGLDAFPPRQIDKEQVRGTVTLTPAFRYLYFTTEPEAPLRPWAAAGAPLEQRARPWPLEDRAETDTVTLVVELAASIQLTAYRIGADWVDLQSRFDAEPDPGARQRLMDRWCIPLRGYLRITDRIEPRRLIVRTERDDPSVTKEAWCAVIDFRPEARRGHPLVRVWLDRYFTFRDVTEATAAIRLMDPELANLTAQLAAEVLPSLADLTDWRMPEPGLVPLSVTPLEGKAADPKNLVVRTQAQPSMSFRTSHLCLLNRISGTEGNPEFAGRALTVAPGDLQIAVAHRYLLQDQIVGALGGANIEGLTAKSFTEDFPLRLLSPVKLRPIKGATPVIERMAVYVDDSATVRISLALDVSHALFGASATADVALTFDPTTTTSKGTPVLRLATAVTADVNVYRVDVAWWVKVLGGGAVITGVLDLVLRKVFRDQLLGGLTNALTAPQEPTEVAIPGGVDFTVAGFSLNQSAAEEDPAVDDLPATRRHDLVITLSAVRLPGTLDIACTKKDSADPGTRLDAVGGLLPNGRPWAMSIDEAVAAARSGTVFTSVAPGGSRAAVRIVQPAGRPAFLQTVADANPANNLFALPDCP